MGKNKHIVRGGLSEGPRRRVSRATFAAAVDAGVRRAGSALFELVSREDIERIKQNANEMDVNTWQCRGSCGCPMANLGVVTVSSTESGSAGSVASAFAGGYDRYLGRNHGILSAATLVIED